MQGSKAPRYRRFAIVAATAVIASIGIAACGGLDSGEVEEIFRGQAEQVLEASGQDETITSVECPEEIENEEGNTFECTATFSDGSSITNTGTVTDSDEGTVEFQAETLEGSS